ncbi:TPA: hypothetical protein ACH3X2_002309 [Trebouxia sp. C0005]
MYSVEDDHFFCSKLPAALKLVDDITQQGKAALPHMEALVIYLARDDSLEVLGPHLILPLIQQRLDGMQADAKPDSSDLRDSSAAQKADEVAAVLLAEEDTAARQAAAKRTKKQKQKLRKQLTRQLTQQQPAHHQQQEPDAECFHDEASQAGHGSDTEPSSRLAGPAKPIQALSTAAPQPEHNGQHACCKESDTSQRCTASSQDQNGEADSLVDHPLSSKQGSQHRAASQDSSRCKEPSAQQPEPDSAHLHALFRQRHALTQQEDLRHCASHTNVRIAEPATLPADSMQAKQASVEAAADTSDVAQSSGNKVLGVHLPSLLVCPLTQKVLRQPVIAADGHTYEKAAIEEWLLQQNASPVTGLALAHFCLVPNLSIRSLILGNVGSA